MTNLVRPSDAAGSARSLPPARREALVETLAPTSAKAGGVGGHSPPAGPPPAPSHPVASPAARSLEEFVERYGLAALVEEAGRIAARCFTLDSPVVAELVEDAEAGDTWVALTVRARGEIPEVREAHRRYTREWLSVAPPGTETMVRLSISLL